MKVLVSIGLGLTAALIGLDVSKSSGVWSLPRALEQEHEAGVAPDLGALNDVTRRVWPQRPRHMPWDEICSDLAFQVRARNSMVQAIHSVSQQGTSDAHKKLGKAYKLYETGVPIFKALETVAGGDAELSMIAAILEIGSVSGGDTATLLWRAFEILRRRRVFRGEVDAKLSEARITSWLLLALPWFIGFFMLRYEPDLLKGFAASREGKLLTIAAAVLWAVGGTLIKLCLGSVCPASADARRYSKGERGKKTS